MEREGGELFPPREVGDQTKTRKSKQASRGVTQVMCMMSVQCSRLPRRLLKEERAGNALYGLLTLLDTIFMPFKIHS